QNQCYSNPIQLRIMRAHSKDEHQFHPIFFSIIECHITENLAQQALRFKRSAPFIVTTKYVIW
ncbi:hypothetical protein AB4236_12245, partial [Vibrio lentus]